MLRDAKRRPVVGAGAHNITGEVVDTHSSAVVANGTGCPLACSPSCTFRCPVPLAERGNGIDSIDPHDALEHFVGAVNRFRHDVRTFVGIVVRGTP